MPKAIFDPASAVPPADGSEFPAPPPHRPSDELTWSGFCRLSRFLVLVLIGSTLATCGEVATDNGETKTVTYSHAPAASPPVKYHSVKKEPPDALQKGT